MIEFKRNENKVVIQVKHGIFYDGGYFEFELNQGFAYQAELMKRQFEKHMKHQLARVQREAYNQGWKDAKAKVKKETEFWGNW